MNRPLLVTLVSGACVLGLAILAGEKITIHDARSLLTPTLQRSEVIGFVAGLGTTFAALPDLLKMLRQRSTAGFNPTMAGITGTFQLLWIYYGLLIASRPVVAWNMLGALINLVTVVAYRRLARGRGVVG